MGDEVFESGIRLSRRQVLTVAAVAGGASLLAARRGAASRNESRGPTPVPFQVDLPIPAVASPVRSDSLADYYEIHQRRVVAEIFPGLQTPLWTYDGTFPGPTIWAREGRASVITHVNDLIADDVRTSVHTHGALVNGDNDGHPDDHVPPGTSRTYAIPNQSHGPRALQSARTMWYHDHFMRETGRNVNNGLAGFYLLDDDSVTSQVLPRGEFDIPLMIADRLFNADGSLVYTFPQEFKNGIEGNVMLVNGAVQPRFSVGTRRYRFRVLNASSFRQFELAFDNGMPFQVVATEGGYLSSPITVPSLFIAQAERYEIVVDFSQVPLNTSLVLKNRQGTGTVAQVMRFDVTRRLVDDSTVPTVLRAIETIPVSEATVRRTFEFKRSGGAFTINAKPYDGGRIDASPRAGTTEIWTIRNGGGGWTHPVHVHLVNFQALSRDRVPLRAYETNNWKETLFLPENATAKIIMTWPDVPDDVLARAATTFVNRYVFHCHNLQHEDRDMMAQLQVLPRL